MSGDQPAHHSRRTADDAGLVAEHVHLAARILAEAEHRDPERVLPAHRDLGRPRAVADEEPALRSGELPRVVTEDVPPAQRTDLATVVDVAADHRDPLDE